jgi:protocatechuate 3,4-dioxygenase beta subunit
MKPFTRRGLLKGSVCMAGLVAFSRRGAAAILTPSTAEGPFYPRAAMRFADVDNNLVKVSGAIKKAGGEIIILKGKLLSKDGKPLAGLRIEIWQCDVNGKYLHPHDNRSVVYDTGFQGSGHDISDINGSYRFTTIKPTVYPGRTPHIHVKVLNGQQQLLTTQFYIGGEKNNHTDFLFRRMSAKQARSVSMIFTQRNNILETNIDLII